MASGLASIIGGLAQGITDFGKSAADMFGGAATNNALTVGLDALLNKKSLGQASADARQRQNDYRKWLYDTDSTKDAAAKGLGTALNGAQAVMDFIPGIGQSAPVNALQGAIGGLADEFKFNGENYDLGRAAGRAAIGAGANVAAGGLGKALANSGSKVLSNGVLRGAAAGGLSGAISQGGNAAIEGGNADQILQSAAQGAKFGALMGAGTGGVQSLAGALKKTRTKNSAPAIMDEEVVMAELAPEQVYYHGSPEAGITEFDIKRAGKNTGSGEKAIFFTDSPSVADEYSYERKPTDSMFVNEKGKKGKVYRANLKMDNTLDLDNLTDDQIRELWNYATPLGKLNGQEDFIQKMTDWRDKYHNAQLTKGYLDLAALQDSPYDSFSARMYPNTDNTAKEYGVFSKDQISLLPDEEVMAERVAPGQLGLFDQTATKAPETGYSQLGLFDQPTQPVTPKTIDVADVNPYAPVNGQITQTMRDRASETLKNYKKGTPDNDLYNRIDPQTLPSGYRELRELLDNSSDFIKQRIGADDIKKASPEKVAAYLYPEGTTDYDRTIRDLEYAKGAKTKFGKAAFKDIENRVKERIAKDARGQLGEQAELSPEIRRNLSLYGLDDISFRNGYTAAADNAISERLGIAPGNTLKYNGAKDTGSGVLGRYKTKSRNIATAKRGDPEEALSNVAHERLHSFQNEAGKFAAADKRKGSGYDKEVIDAYNELSESLQDSQLGWEQMREIGRKLGRRDSDLPYYADVTEQEARMLQQYLHDRGYTNSIDTALNEKMGLPKEFNTDYYPAFDKFFDKLRELSKKGVALPAILATLGLGGYATQNQEEDKDNGQQI